MGSCSLPSTYKNICHGSYIIVYIQLFFKASDMFWHILWCQHWGVTDSQSDAAQTKSTVKASNHLPGGRGGKESRSSITCAAAPSVKMYAEKVVTEGKMGMCARQTCSARCCSCSHSVHPSLLHHHKLRRTDTDTHIFSDWNAVLVELPLTLFVFCIWEQTSVHLNVNN